MHGGDKCPTVRADTKMRDVIYEMSRKGLGMTCVVDGSGAAPELLGIITDGDLRRRMERGGEILDLTAGDVMTRDPIAVARHTLAAEALSLMERRKITSVVVVDRAAPNRVAGVLHLHDLWEQ
jgi:arabinose-5-phosphate isomerase